MARLNGSAPEAPGRSGGNSNIITNWPTKENALIVKLVCDPNYDNGRKVYRPATYFTHSTGTKGTEKGRHVCQTFFGAQSSPENDFFWEQVKKLSALKKAGQTESVEGKIVKDLVKTFKPSKRGYIMVVEPDSKVVKAVRVPEQVLDVLMGRKADHFIKQEIPSLLDSMAAKGIGAFDLNIPKGWIKLYKTGEGLNTKYHVEQALVEKEDETKDGRKIKYMDDFVGNVHRHLLSDDFDTSEIPNVVDFERQWAFSPEESIAFVKALGTLEGTPVRFRRKENADGPSQPEGEEAVVVGSQPEYQTVSEDEIPY